TCRDGLKLSSLEENPCWMLQMLPAVLWLVCWSRFRNGATIMRCCNDEVDEKERVQIASKLTVSRKLRCLW
ncbi:Os05g0302400, partial [Oryza sativa Japonica Group]